MAIVEPGMRRPEIVPAPHPEKVAVLALPGVAPFNLGVPGQVFAGPTPRELGLYDLTVCSTERSVRTSDGYGLAIDQRLDVLDDADLILVPGPAVVPPELPDEAADALLSAHARGARLASLCTGAFVLAALGLLDGRRATTHWMHAETLRRQYPAALVEPHALFCDEGSILTSAGLAAGIDLCLHVVGTTHGAEIANRCARFLVAAPQRPGGQAQFIEHPVPKTEESSLAATRVWMLEHLDQDLTLDAMARQACTSRRSFTRQFRVETGRSPLDWLLEQRIIRARLLLETTTDPVSAVALRAGLGSDAALRHHFRRALGVTPTAYRQSFSYT